jgi:hypothetical protein
MRRLVRPEGMPSANGYSRAVAASGPLIAICGQVPPVHVLPVWRGVNSECRSRLLGSLAHATHRRRAL